IRDKNIKVNKAYLVSCVNSRVDDLAQAAEFIKGKKVADSVKMYIAAASKEVQAESEKRGDWQTLIDAGAIPLIPGCGQCIGLGEGLLEDGEVGISATNRNFKGRMGSKNAEAYLSSPAVVAASAVAGKIDFPGDWKNTELDTNFKENVKKEAGKVEVKIMDGFPESIEGDILYCHQDNLNTDGIYPGKYTYIDDFTPQQQAEVVMENYDGEFVKLAKEGDILIGGYNFGTGSSREQAATALKHKGIRLVLAGSFSQTYKRNAINNGYLVLEAPELVNDLKAKYGQDKLTVASGIKAKIDFSSAKMEFDGKTYSLSPVGLAAQELVLSEGLENWVKEKIS
ncbi:MAG: homoaconitase, partial [Calditrichia bacterium]|nr:homoaconitase [Calditrichia bacterium]